MAVKQLGYLLLECTSEVYPRMVTLFQDVFAIPVDQPDAATALVRMDGRPFRIKLQQGSSNRVAGIGWDAGDAATLATLSAEVAAHGFKTTNLDAGACAARAASAVVAFQDQDGFAHELFVDKPFAADAALNARFVCGDEDNGVFGLGHIVQMCGDRQATQDFYTKIFGFGVSDRITWPVADLFFLHCNQRHHTVALSNEGFGLTRGMLHHLMLETKSKAEVDRAYAKLQELGFPVLMSIGQHTNDEVYSFYMLAPIGFGIEFGYGGKVVTDPKTWEYREFDAPSSWGHDLMMVPPQ